MSNSANGGLNVKIQHNKTLSSYYAHLGTVSVNKGEKVDMNTVIGTVGDSR